MRMRTTMLMLAVLVSPLFGQSTTPSTPTQKKPTTTATKPAAPPSQATTSTSTTAKKTTATTAAKPGAKPAAKPMNAKQTPAAPKPAAPQRAKSKRPVMTGEQEEPPPVVAKAPKKPSGGKRDPFLNPIVTVAGGPSGGPCSGGKRCLVIDQVALKGVVKTRQGMLALVENAAKKSYVLREKDPVFNGYVLKITGDSVVFKENVIDNLGRESSREVVRKVSAPAV